jgi:hypothetical protein
MSSLNGSSNGTFVPIETRCLTLPGPCASYAYSQASHTGVFARVDPSTKSSPNLPTAIGSKMEVAADVAQQTSHIVTLSSRSLLLRGVR